MPEITTQLPERSTERMFAPHLAQREARPRMLFAAVELVQSLPALRRAQTLAERAGAELYVLQVSKAPPADAAELSPAWLASSRGLLRLCNRGAHERVPRDHILTEAGEFAKVVTHTARSLRVSMVVIAGGRATRGKRVVQIADETGVPVLVSRRSNHSGVLLAALDLQPTTEQELRLSVELAERLAYKLALVHNVQPVVHAASSPVGHTFCTVIEPSRTQLSEIVTRLHALGAEAGMYVDALVLSEPSTDQAILHGARAQGADLIVVGLHHQGFFERLFRTGLAMRIVDRSERSVLVAPLAA